MRSVGIITKISRNYGAVLQAYALRRYLEERGCHAQVIRYDNAKIRRSFRVLEWPITMKSLRRLAHLRANLRRNRRFFAFRDQYLHLTRPYLTLDALQSDPPAFDIYVSGSDQVWNPANDFDPAYFLDFGGKDVRRVSYAASIGVSSIEDRYRDAFVRGVARFTHIAVRERSAQQILRELGFDARVTLDPSLLHTRAAYDPLAVDPATETPYILCYLMNPPAFTAELVARARKELGMRVVILGGGPYVPRDNDLRVLDAGPREFLGYVRSAAFVITSSFHATAFSMLFHRPMAAVLHTSTGSRVADLLESVGASERVMRGVQDFQPSLLKMDYSDIDCRLEAMRADSAAYIDNFLA